jgi:hypothetical protein
VPSYAVRFGAAGWQASGVHRLSIWALLKSRLSGVHLHAVLLAMPDGRPQVASASRPNFSNKELRSNEVWVRTMFDFALSYSRSRVVRWE